jgi:hypothetical protein
MLDANTDSDIFARLRAAAAPEDLDLTAILERLKARHTDSIRDKLINAALRRVVRHALLNTSPQRLAQGRKRFPAIGLCVTGPSGAGKSTILARCLADNPVFNVPGRHGHGSILLKVKAPKPSTLKALAVDMLHRLGYPITKKVTAPEAWRLVRTRLRELGIMFVWIDEFQHVIDRKNPEDTREVRDTIKMLLEEQDWPIYVILSGLPHITVAIEDKLETDIQVIRRFRFQAMPNLDLADEKDGVFEFIRRSVNTARLTLDFDIEDELINRLHHAALHRLGVFIELVVEAIEVALVAKRSTLSNVDFVAVYEQRTGSAPIMNPFIADDWHVLDCKGVLREHRDDEHDDNTPAPKPDDGNRAY